jgi:hypothetical protein
MKKLAMVLLLASTTVWAGWEPLAQDNGSTSYADPATLVSNGAIATMWSLLDYKEFQRMVEVGYFSQKAQAEFDCKEPRFRVLTLSLHAEHMGAGKVIYADEMPHEWEAVQAGTREETLWKRACK